MIKKLIRSLFFKRKKTPTIIQMEAIECGAVCLGIILAYYKKFVSMEELRDTCGISREGCSVLNIIQGAQKFQIHAEALKTEIHDLHSMQFPMIIFWKFNHFIVLEGVKKNKFFINDPACGHRTVYFDEFNKSFTGIAIEMKKTENFKKSGTSPSLYQTVKKRLSGMQSSIIYILICTFILSLLGLALPIFTQIFFDKILTMQMGPKFFFSGFFTVIFLFGILTYFQRHILTFFNTKISIQLSSKFFMHILKLPMRFFSLRYVGEIANRFSQSDRAVELLTGPIMLTATNFMFLFIYLFLMVQLNLTITLVTFGLAIINIIVLMFIYRKKKDAYASYMQDYGKNIGVSVGTLKNIETIKSFGIESDYFARWSGYFAKAILALQKTHTKDIFLISLPPFIIAISIAFYLSFGIHEIMKGSLTIGSLLALKILILNLLSPIVSFTNISQVIQEMNGSFNRIDDVLNHEIDFTFQNKEEKTIPTSQLKLKGYLELKDVAFGYNPNSPPLIENFNLSLHVDKWVAFVGHTGCGKTTLGKIISLFYKPWKGDILFDNQSYSSIDMDLLRRSLASVDQNIFILEGTIADNITFLDKTILEEDMIKAAKDACIHDDIIAMQNGYDTYLEEEGKNLSGGQKQRLEIARALARNPTILILDEATSSLDSDTEEKIIENIYRRTCTTIIIAHRLSTIRNCDEIILLEKGKIIQRGLHKELIKQKGSYQQLIKSQGLQI